MSDDEVYSRPRFFGGPLDGEPTPRAQYDRTIALRPAGCENGFYVLHNNDRYEWREVPERKPFA